MTWDIALILAEDGILTGAIYALLALASVLVFATTRIIFVPQGEFVTFGALTLAAFQLGQTPNIIYLVGLLAAIVCVMDGVALVRAGRMHRLPRMLAVNALLPALIIAAAIYFGVFPLLLTVGDPAFTLKGRSRRPPLDPVNALLSFLYSLLAHDCRSALAAAGLDAAVGFLHRDRPGRPSLAPDLMEELRPVLADRIALTLLNRRQLSSNDFETRENGAVYLREVSRKKVLVEWQERKREELLHPFVQEKVTWGLVPHLQARLLARHLRGDLDAYPAFLWK